MARNHLGSKSPFRTATLWLIWGWLLIFALLPNILVIAVSFLTRDSSAFIRLIRCILRYLSTHYGWQVSQRLSACCWATLLHG